MKSIIGKIAALSLILCLCFSLSSCVKLKELKSMHAVYTDDTKEKIEYQGEIYTLVDATIPEDVYTLIKYTQGYLTEKDVPVLLAAEYAEYFDITYDGNIIYLIDEEKIYCREGYAEELQKTIEKDEYIYPCATFEDSSNERQVLIPIKEHLKKEIETIISGVPLKNDPEEYDYINIFNFDETKRFYKDYICLVVGYPDEQDYDIDYITELKFDSLYLYRYTEERDYYYYYKIPKEKENLFKYLIELRNEIEYEGKYAAGKDWIIYE